MTVAVLLLGAMIRGASAAAPAAAMKLEIVELDGKLTMAGKPLAQGDVVSASSSLGLSKGGRAVIRIGEGVILLKGPANFTPNPDGVSLKFGGMLNVLKALKRTWIVSTPGAVAAVRGTEFYIEVRPDGVTYLCLCQGTLDVLPAGAKPKTKEGAQLKAKHHSPFQFQTAQGHLIMEDVSMENHTDAELEALRALLK